MGQTINSQPRFEVKFHWGFFTYALLDERGQAKYDKLEAAKLAEQMYKDEWLYVTNVLETLSRKDYIAACLHASA